MSSKKSNDAVGCLVIICFAGYMIYKCATDYLSECGLDWIAVGKFAGCVVGAIIIFKILRRIFHGRPKPASVDDYTIEIRGVEINRTSQSDDRSASPRQLEYIKALGGKPKSGMTFQEASELINELKIEHELKLREEVEHRLDARRQAVSKRFKKVTQSK